MRGFVGSTAVKLGVIAVAAIAVAMGMRLVAFEHDIADLELDDGTSQERPARSSHPPDAKPVLGRWVASYGVAVTARNVIVKDPDQPMSAAARMLDAVHALELNPTSSRLWLVYADMSWQMGLFEDRVWGALDMAQLTGRREVDVMVFNTLQTIRIWEQASSSRKERALTAVILLHDLIGQEGRTALSRALALKSPEVRAEISATLAERLGSNQSWLTQLGM